ncbi:MAG TPA: hypothetical protein VME17_19665 [Bryobacteraceae bacterium]|nr:hypothetical protein [Bryobacteraceae bacterium]
MRNDSKALICFCAAAVLAAPTTLIAQKRYIAAGLTGEITRPALDELWSEPKDIRSRNLFYGPGGENHVPHGPFTFVKEDLNGTNPKYDVRDRDGVKWKLKVGTEARPETVATRIVWAAGYHADEDYFLPEVTVSNLPADLHRGRKYISAGGVIHNVRLKRTEEEKKEANWRWRENPFADTRELYGLRVLMAVINNWDLKNVNNAIREIRLPNGEEEQIYEVSDLGASFGSDGRERTHAESKGNLRSYENSKFLKKVRPEFVDFGVPARPSLIFLLDPHEFFMRLDLRWIGRRIPREDARWMGDLLGQLSRDQIRDAFRAAGYSGEQLDGFASVLEQRIKELKAL